MASSVIHMVVANEINKKLNRNKTKLLLGTIAPDISRLVGDSKILSHFSSNESENIPNIDKFLDKYKKYLYNDFVMGYYIHLYTDYLWFKYFIDDIDYSSMITTIDGDRVWCDRDDFIEYVYNDYTNINIALIDRYNLDLKIFYNDIPSIEHIIEEIPMDRLKIIVNKTGDIIANSKVNKAYLFDIVNVEKFVELSTDLILASIYEISFC